MVLHVSIDVECWICDCLNSNFDMALLDIHASLFHGFCHLEALQNHGQPPAAEHGHVELFALIKALSRVNQTHFKKLVNKLLGFGDPIRVTGLKDH